MYTEFTKNLKYSNYIKSPTRFLTVQITIMIALNQKVAKQPNFCFFHSWVSSILLLTLFSSMLYAVPGPPTNVIGLCSVVLWGQPSQPSGTIERFDVQFSIPGVWYGTIHRKQRDNHIVQEGDTPSDYPDHEVFVGVSELHKCINMLSTCIHLVLPLSAK